MGKFEVRDNKIIIEIYACHSQVRPFYPNYDINQPSPLVVNDYTLSTNTVGHAQRAWLIYWSLRAFAESEGMISCDLGSAGVIHPGCLSVDRVGTGEIPEYGGIMSGVQIKADANHLLFFGKNSFSPILSWQTVEH